jgi:predicted ribosomally synthesized peptide with nif11-like leader
MEQAERFIVAVQDDSNLRSALEAADLDEGGQTLLAIARAHGFDFTIDEFRERFSIAQTELSNRQLDQMAGGSGELESLSLQSRLQRQQQLLQTLSNISKALHDTSSTMIRNIG